MLGPRWQTNTSCRKVSSLSNPARKRVRARMRRPQDVNLVAQLWPRPLPLTDMALDLQPLHQVYQTISPSSCSALVAHPLVLISELRRRPVPKRSARGTSSAPGADEPTELGEVEWVLTIGGEGVETGTAPPKGPKKSETVPEEWWKVCLCAKEVEELMKQVHHTFLLAQRVPWLTAVPS